MPWSARFCRPLCIDVAQPIRLPGGGELASLEEAGRHIEGLPAAIQQSEPWQNATRELLRAAADGGAWLIFARLALERALQGPSETHVRRSREAGWKIRRRARKPN